MNLKKLFSAALFVALAFLLVASAPLQAKNTDNKIEQSVRKTFVFKTYLKSDAIKVNSVNGTVTLSGTVATENNKMLAEETVADLPGVLAVNNQLTVTGVAHDARSDEWIAHRIRGMYVMHRGVYNTDTDVSVKDGKVTLRGNAATKAQRELISEYAREVSGVKEVDNKMTVTDPPLLEHKKRSEKVDDASITSQVRMALRYRHGTDPYDTKVSTRKGVVTLNGTAVNRSDIDLLTKRVLEIRGVKRVDNQMTVGLVQSSTN